LPWDAGRNGKIMWICISLYAIFYSIEEISSKAVKIFPQQFSEKLFREQLAFHKGIDYSEPVEYLVEPVSDEVIKSFLLDVATDIL